MADSDLAFVGRCKHGEVVAALVASALQHDPKALSRWTTKKGGNLKIEQTTVGEARKLLVTADCACVNHG